jgi:hypothetical protein
MGPASAPRSEHTHGQRQEAQAHELRATKTILPRTGDCGPEWRVGNVVDDATGSDWSDWLHVKGISAVFDENAYMAGGGGAGRG